MINPVNSLADYWKNIPESDWENWQWQISNRVMTYEGLKDMLQLTPSEVIGVKRSKGRLLMAIPPYWLSLIDPMRQSCPIRRQAIPSAEEFDLSGNDMEDPCGEDRDSPVPGLVHRYPNRVLLLVTEKCAMYCRHCTRRRLVGCEAHLSSPQNFERAYDYIRSNRRIRDVLISGGDPLMLPDETIEDILKNLRSIPNVEFLRLGTRMPVTVPMRVTENLISIFKKYSPVWISLHFNHPKEITKRVKRACDMLVESGIPIGSQTVLLRGINDRTSTMKRLMHELLKIRVRPYYIYQCDPAKGISHFRTSISVGINIMERLRGHTSGYAVPTYVVDAPGGGGKIPVAPNYVISQAKGTFTLRNYAGNIFTYHEPVEEETHQIVPDRERHNQQKREIHPVRERGSFTQLDSNDRRLKSAG